jgi:hypothetical protein
MDLFLPHDPFGFETTKVMVEEKKDEIQPFRLLGGKNRLDEQSHLHRST